MKNSSDASLFAWGGIMDEQTSDSDALTPFPRRPIGVHLDVSYLLAPSPHSFERAIDFVPMLRRKEQPYPPRVEHDAQASRKTKRTKGPFDHIELPTFEFSSYGVACRLPVFEADDKLTIAVLLCLEADDHLGLLLEHDTVRSNRDPTRPRYYVSAKFRKSPDAGDASRAVQATRMIRLGDDLYNLRFNGKAVKARWRDIHIIPHSSGWVLPSTSLSHLRLSPVSDIPFRIPKWLTARFTALGFKPFQQICQWDSESPSTSPKSVLVSFTDPWRSEYIDIFLGICDAALAPRWARVVSGHGDHMPSDLESDADAPASHDCSHHHIDSWPMQTKDFGDPLRLVQLSFTSYRLNPLVAVLHLELLGDIYGQMLREAKITIPTHEELRTTVQAVPSPFPFSYPGLPPWSAMPSPAAPTHAPLGSSSPYAGISYLHTFPPFTHMPPLRTTSNAGHVSASSRTLRAEISSGRQLSASSRAFMPLGTPPSLDDPASFSPPFLLFTHSPLMLPTITEVPEISSFPQRSDPSSPLPTTWTHSTLTGTSDPAVGLERARP